MILWLDLETTGTEISSHIIEVGCIITKDEYPFEELDHGSWVIKPQGPMTIDLHVLNMHLANALWADLDSGQPLAQVEMELVMWVNEHSPGQRITLAGSGVSHFDRKFIKHYMPKLECRLQHFHIDVGVVRRFLRAVNPEMTKFDGESGKNHRALTDIYCHLDEARKFGALLQNVEVPV